ncbi:GNAT family N-acetyltransferase [Chromobacterium amazonense]|uniref:GNAT family N-acetyltransferase n=1 Tax=Chromobacterium amazonense TaxID=1382803 RepID=UPI003F78C526
METLTGETVRLRIEPLREAHADELFDAFQAAALYRFIPERPHPSLASMRAEYREFAGGAPADSGEIWLNWALRLKDGGEAIGTLQATRFADGSQWLGYKLAPAHWGQGLASEALGWLAHGPLLAAVDSRHLASQRVLLKNGFRLLREESAELHGEPSLDRIYVFESGQSNL